MNLSAAEVIYRQISQAQEAKPVAKASEEVKRVELTREDVTAIIARQRTVTPEELQEIIARKDLTSGERNQISVDLTIAMAQRARQVRGRREAPGANFIHDVLNLTETPHGYIERGWFDNLLRSNAAAIARCKNHRPPRCSCWRGAREALWQAAHTYGEKSPEAWTALQVWEILAELEVASRPDRGPGRGL